MAVACHKEAALTTLKPVAFTAPLTVSTNTAILTKATDDANVLTFTWPAVSYPYKAKVTYTLQADLPADTVGATAWGKAQSVIIGDEILTKTFKGSDLNALALKVGVPGNDTAKVVFRIQAYQDRNAFSRSVTVTVSPYTEIIVFVPPPPPASLGLPVLYLPGFYQNWSPGTAGNVAAEKDGIYEGYVYMPQSADPAAYHFKFTSDPDWGHINYGDGGAGLLSTDGNKGDLVLPGPGFYQLIANTTTLTWSATPVVFGIIGDATPGGWDSDTPMAYDAVNHVWKVTANMKTNASFKFRANAAWSIDFGIDPATGRLAYADNPAYPYNDKVQNLTVAEDGNYTIYLDVHDPNAYYYYVHKN
ncbi:MAG: hypothetical protein JWQ66_3335 [Mucilaginibacter sp.]|nr:hypothetical protein [Mucilaginibacter sp.]